MSRRTRLREDASLGVMLAIFFGGGLLGFLTQLLLQFLVCFHEVFLRLEFARQKLSFTLLFLRCLVGLAVNSCGCCTCAAAYHGDRFVCCFWRVCHQ